MKAATFFWGADQLALSGVEWASRVLVAVSRRNALSCIHLQNHSRTEKEKVRNGEDTVANTRDAHSTVAQGRLCAPQNFRPRSS